jgi:putative tryptophan/tyrosine transport system substrate-binding protein
MGFVTNLARPGGDVTGLSNMAHDLSGKLVELFVEIVPSMKHVGVVQNPSNPSMPFILSKTENAIRALGLRFEVVDAKSGEEFEAALQSLSAKGVNGVVLLADPSLVENRRRIAEVALKTQIPTAFQRRESVEAGGLFSYGSSLSDQLRLATLYVDRILKGTKPAELPVEQPTKFELVVNLKTAKSLGLDVPSTLLARADQVIE